MNKGTVTDVVASLGAELQPLGYLVFQSDMGFGMGPDRIGVVKGSRTTPAFRPYGYRRDLRYPSINVLAKRWQGNLYVIAVNSAESSVDAAIEGLGGADEAEVLFEDRTVPVEHGRLTDSFTWLGVHV